MTKLLASVVTLACVGCLGAAEAHAQGAPSTTAAVPFGPAAGAKGVAAIGVPGTPLTLELSTRDWLWVAGMGKNAVRESDWLTTTVFFGIEKRKAEASAAVESTASQIDVAERDALMDDRFREEERRLVAERSGAQDATAEVLVSGHHRFVLVRFTRTGIDGRSERALHYTFLSRTHVYRLLCAAAAPVFARYEPGFGQLAWSLAKSLDGATPSGTTAASK